MDLYIAGPMTGHSGFNFAAFDAARKRLEKDGHKCVSPADLVRYKHVGHDFTSTTDPEGFDIASMLLTELDEICHADGVYMLAGWESSDGAKIEHLFAKRIGKRIFYESEVH